jgi:STE24 endopeptidase
MNRAEDNHGKKLKETDAKRYNRIKIRISISDLVINIIFISILAFSGISGVIVNQIELYVQNPYLQFLIFLAIVGMSAGIIGFPLDFYSSYILEHKFKLSTQNLFTWTVERIKSLGVGLMLGIPVALAFYYFLIISGKHWWLYFSAFIFLFAILLARLAPVLIFPIFYKFKPLDHGEISEKIIAIIKKNNIQIKGIYSFDMSRETKKANAGFTGIGKSKRIILSDTLIENFTPDEVAAVFAHEVGHYKKRHIIKNILLSGIVIFTSFFLCGQLYEWTLYRYGFVYIHEIAALPILFFYLSLFSIIAMPLSNYLSRSFEIEADRFSLDILEDKKSFISSMEKLAEINLADKEPHPLIEFLLYSHPSIKKRIEYARGQSALSNLSRNEGA